MGWRVPLASLALLSLVAANDSGLFECPKGKLTALHCTGIYIFRIYKRSVFHISVMPYFQLIKGTFSRKSLCDYPFTGK
jgi:hypothetical protein